MLTVVAIITVITGLVLAGVSSVRKRQRAHTTDQNVLKIQEGIDNQAKILRDQVRADRKNGTQDYRNVLIYCDNDPDRAEALLMLLRLRHAFPQNYAEATSNVVLPGCINWPPHKAYAGFAGATAGTATAEEQSAALLFAALSSMAAGGNGFEMDAANSMQAPLLVGNINATIFRDAWGNPVAFKRYLSALVQIELDLNPYTNVKNNLKDPYDPLGKLSSWNPTVPQRKIDAQNAVGALFDNHNKVNTAYTAGEDQTPGTTDDVFGYRLGKLGQGGTK